jgi:bidirectional [NiFe] hydrogenase diaphorase subunit
MPQVTLTIDGKSVTAEKGEMVLDVCRAQRIPVPTLCHHEAIGGDGRCRLCVVELREGDWFKLVTSCLYPVKEGLNILTNSDRVRKTRGMILELLLARCPTSADVRELAADYGVTKPRFDHDFDKGKCILCGMCVRTCAEVIGVSAIGNVNRGIHKVIGTPYMERAAACIGCGACAFVCPTGHIELHET